MRVIGLVLTMVAVMGAGCAGGQQMRANQQATMYSSMESTALVYSDPAAASPLQDHPLRWMAYIFHPVGVLMDYTVNRPFYDVAATYPAVFGATSEDAMLEALRYSIFPQSRQNY
jgi:hypothetical protein